MVNFDKTIEDFKKAIVIKWMLRPNINTLEVM